MLSNRRENTCFLNSLSSSVLSSPPSNTHRALSENLLRREGEGEGGEGGKGGKGGEGGKKQMGGEKTERQERSCCVVVWSSLSPFIFLPLLEEIGGEEEEEEEEEGRKDKEGTEIKSWRRGGRKKGGCSFFK